VSGALRTAARTSHYTDKTTPVHVRSMYHTTTGTATVDGRWSMDYAACARCACGPVDHRAADRSVKRRSRARWAHVLGAWMRAMQSAIGTQTADATFHEAWQPGTVHTRTSPHCIHIRRSGQVRSGLVPVAAFQRRRHERHVPPATTLAVHVYTARHGAAASRLTHGLPRTARLTALLTAQPARALARCARS